MAANCNIVKIGIQELNKVYYGIACKDNTEAILKNYITYLACPCVTIEDCEPYISCGAVKNLTVIHKVIYCTGVNDLTVHTKVVTCSRVVNLQVTRKNRSCTGVVSFEITNKQ